MGKRKPHAAVAGVVVMTSLAGCQGGARNTPTPVAGSPRGGQETSAPSVREKNYTAGQLENALINPPTGATYTKRGSGPYDKVLKKFSGGGTSENVKEEGSSCGVNSRDDSKLFGSVPSAFVSFTQGERSLSVVLVAAPGAEAKQAAIEPIPKACRSTRIRVGGTTITTTVVSDEPFAIGDGGRISRSDEVSDGLRLRSWEVTFAGPGYLAMTSVNGLNITRADAERLARQAYRKTSATLRS
jgi:hypothetical protein